MRTRWRVFTQVSCPLRKITARRLKFLRDQHLPLLTVAVRQSGAASTFTEFDGGTD